MKQLVHGLFAAGAIAAAFAAQAQTGSAADPAASGRLLAAGCVACHGTAGRAQAGAKVLAGMEQAVFIGQMQAFKSGQRPATVMHQLSKGYGDAEIAMLANYFASQRR